jgi:hypothetical protein
MQPYRIPLQPSDPARCTDRNACAPFVPRIVPDRRPYALSTIILAALFAGSVPAAFAMGAQSESRGRVEIDPSVVDRAVAKNRAIKAPSVTLLAPPPKPQVQKPAALSLLADGETHDAMTLLTRARKLIDAGTPITLVFVDMHLSTRDRLRAGAGMPTVTPIDGRGDGQVTALRLNFIPLESPLRDVGLDSGDVILSINGYRPSDDIETFYDRSLQGSGHAAIEILRGATRMVINLWWSGP